MKLLPLPLGFLVLSTPVLGQTTVTLAPTQDTYLQDSNPTANFGASQDIWFGRGDFFGLGTIRTLVQFDLTALPHPNVRSATFSAYQYATEPAAGSKDSDLHRCLTAWSETTATWASQPAYDPITVWATAGVGDSFTTGWIDWDATAIVRAQVAGTLSNDGWLFRVRSEDVGVSRLGYFHSSEYAADPTRRPKLDVELYDLAFGITPEPLVPGGPADFQVAGAAPFSTVLIGYSLAGPGLTSLPFGLEIELSSPRLLVALSADASGAASFSTVVPGAASGLTVWFQGLTRAGQSNVVQKTVL